MDFMSTKTDHIPHSLEGIYGNGIASVKIADILEEQYKLKKE